jgi:heptosyltransferase II
MILYIQTAFLGDLLLSVPTLKKIKSLYPEKVLHVICRKGLGAFLLKEGLADQVFDDFKKTKPSIDEIKNRLGGHRYDLLICAHESIRSNLLCFQIRAKTKIGYKNMWNGWVFDQRIQRTMHWPEVLRQLELLSGLDVKLNQGLEALRGQSAPFTEIPAWSTMNIRSPIPHGTQDKIVAVAPGSVWPTKRWDKFSDLVGQLLANRYQVILIGSPAEREISARIKSQHPLAQDLTGKTSLPQMLDVLAGADALVCNDSGAMHMASLLGLPTVAIFGPTVLEFGYQAWNDKAVFVERKNLKCRPCSSHGTEKCPIGTHECMTEIPAKQVLEKIQELI